MKIKNGKSKISGSTNRDQNFTEKDEAGRRKDIHDPLHKRTLFVRFPRPVHDKRKIDELHPGIESVCFKQRCKTWCHIRFESEEMADLALKKLHNKSLEHGKLVVLRTKKYAINNPVAPKEKMNRNVYKIFVKNLPENVTVSDVELAFPGSKSVRIFKKKSKKNKKYKIATVRFRTQNELDDVVQSSKNFKVCGTNVTVSYSKSYMTAKSAIEGKEKKLNVKSKGKKKTALVKKPEAAALSNSENESEEKEDDEEEMSGGESNEKVEGSEGEENVENEGSDCESSDKSDSNGDGNVNGSGDESESDE